MRTLILFCSVFAIGFAAPPAQAQEWTEGPPMSVARYDAAVAVLGGRLYVIGGRNTAGAALGTVERFDPENGQWTTVEELREERYDAAAVAYQGRIVLMGGREDDGAVTEDVEEYVPSEDDWESFQSLGQAREGLGAVVLGGRMYALGGAAPGGALLTTCEYYDAAGDRWYAYSAWALDPPRASFGIVEEGGAAYVAGGFGQFGPLGLFERYTVAHGAVVLDPMPTARGNLALVSDGAALYAIGGRDPNDAVLATVERYDLATGTWTTLAPLNTPREGAVAAYLGGKLYVAGGRDPAGNALRSVEVFEASVDAEPPAMPGAFTLEPAYPNPFSTRTTLTIHTDTPGPLRLAVYDVRGRRVATLLDGPLAAGTHRVTWDGTADDGRALGNGLYLVRALGAEGPVTTRLTLLR